MTSCFDCCPWSSTRRPGDGGNNDCDDRYEKSANRNAAGRQIGHVEQLTTHSSWSRQFRSTRRRARVQRKDQGRSQFHAEAEADEEDTGDDNDDPRQLDLSHSGLDHVPPAIFVYERTLECLFLQSNNIASLPRELFNCRELRVVDLSDNNLTEIPDEAIVQLKHLTTLHAAKNNLADIPISMGTHLPHLTRLDLSGNPLRRIPEAIIQMGHRLQELYLNDTAIQYVPASVGRLSGLRVLEMRENGLTSLPWPLNQLSKSLTRLDLGANEFIEVPEVVGHLEMLTELLLDANRIQTIQDQTFFKLRRLQHLDATANDLDSLGERIDRCASLTHLGLSANCLRQIPASVGCLHQLETLKLDDNMLDFLPHSIGQLANLDELDVSYNCLVDLPETIGACKSLAYLNADHNRLCLLPPSLGACHNLTILSLTDNQLTSLPSELGNLANLSVLSLTDNALRNLPDSFIRLRKISALWTDASQRRPLIPLDRVFDESTRQWTLTSNHFPQRRCETNFSQSGDSNANVTSFGSPPAYEPPQSVDYGTEEENAYYNDPKQFRSSHYERLRLQMRHGFFGAAALTTNNPGMESQSTRSQILANNSPSLSSSNRRGVHTSVAADQTIMTNQTVMSDSDTASTMSSTGPLPTSSIRWATSTTAHPPSSGPHAVHPSAGMATSLRHVAAHNILSQQQLQRTSNQVVIGHQFHEYSKQPRQQQMVATFIGDNASRDSGIVLPASSGSSASSPSSLGSGSQSHDSGHPIHIPQHGEFGDNIDHATHLRQVTERLMANPRTRQSLTGSSASVVIPPGPASGSVVSDHRAPLLQTLSSYQQDGDAVGSMHYENLNSRNNLFRPMPVSQAQYSHH